MEDLRFWAEVALGHGVVAGLEVIWLEDVTGFAVVANLDVEAGVGVVTGFEDVTGFVGVTDAEAVTALELVAGVGRFRFLRTSTVVKVVVVVAESVSVEVAWDQV